MKNIYKLLLLLTVTIGLFSCNRKAGPKEGELIYQIKYLQSDRENSLIALLPKTITIKFKNDNTAAYIEGFWGTFQLRFISNINTKKSYTVLRILDKKYISENHIDSVSTGYNPLKNLKIKETGDTVNIAGFLSHELKISYNTLPDSAISFYYTNELDIDSPNSNTPFKDIEGVLTKFQIQIAGIDMLFELIDYKKIAVNDKEFMPPKNYNKISKDEFNNLLKNFKE